MTDPSNAPVHEVHQAQGPQRSRCAVITVSDTRTLDDDTGGQAVIDHLTRAGHEVIGRDIIPDEPVRMRPLLEALLGRSDLDAILLTGGTGISSRDQTFETVSGLLEKPLPGYGELFRMLSYQEIGPAAMLSRAVGGLARGKVVLTMPGSPAAVRLAMEKIIVPQLPHLMREARR
jgi:molybdenum cofactor biosynthesis protein B